MKCLFLIALALPLAGCQKEFQETGAILKSGAPVEIFWKGSARAAGDVEYMVLSNYNPGHTNNTSGVSIYGSGYHDLDGLVVTFAKAGPSQIIVLDHYFDLENGRFFWVRRKDPSHLEVVQKNITDPMAVQTLGEMHQYDHH